MDRPLRVTLFIYMLYLLSYVRRGVGGVPFRLLQAVPPAPSGQHRPLVPPLCYLLHSHTPGREEREAERDVTHIYSQQRELKKLGGWSSEPLSPSLLQTR